MKRPTSVKQLSTLQRLQIWLQWLREPGTESPIAQQMNIPENVVRKVIEVKRKHAIDDAAADALGLTYLEEEEEIIRRILNDHDHPPRPRTDRDVEDD